MPLLPRGAGDRAAYPVGLPVDALGISVPDMDGLGAAGGQGTAGAGTTGSLAGVPESYRPAATCAVGRGRRRPGKVAAIQGPYGMYLAVLSARRAAEEAARWARGGGGGDVASTVFGPARVGARTRGGDTGAWEQLADGLLRPAPRRDPLQLPQGPLAGWPWERGFAQALVRWASSLEWIPGSGRVTYAELPLDFESHSNRAPPARPGHWDALF